MPTPAKIVCCGLNHADHCRAKHRPAQNLILFGKFPTALIGYGDAITWPAGTSQQVDYEAGWPLAHGKRAHNVPVEGRCTTSPATPSPTMSARCAIRRRPVDPQAKSFDTFCPLGPALVTADEIGDPHSLAIRCRVNGHLLQDLDC